MNNNKFWIVALMLLAALPGTAAAHPVTAGGSGFEYGVLHPFLGLDHFLVMTGLGLWLSRQPFAYRSQGVAVFLGVMLIGAASAMQGLQFAYVETTILLSVLLTGVLLMTSLRQAPGASGLAWIALVAFMHGQAHGNELPAIDSIGAYVSGFVLASLTLQAAGLVCGGLMRRYRNENLSRVYGSLTGLAGIWLLYGA
ncbi:MAG: HupE/UreJ family protein [Gammaproteobacteria bacterium]